jgi:ribosome biogenesis GTPase
MQLTQDPAVLGRIGWRAEDARHLPGGLAGERGIARIVAHHRSGYRAHDGQAEIAVQTPAGMIRAGTDPRDRPAVGDWVVIAHGKPPLIESVVPRRTLLVRAAAGERFKAQPIAANVDVVLVVCGLDGDYNPRRIERYLLLVEGSGALPVVVLTKVDLCVEADSRRAEIQRLAGPAAIVLAVNARDLATAEVLKPWLGPGDTGVLVGSSGAGKSTLTNTLLGIERQRTGAVRGNDDRGRHTTTHRALIMLPSGGCLIDTPGMREIKLTGEEDLAASSFADIELLARDCRFTDCRHESEPGCAVRAALEAGKLEAARWQHYGKLRAELGSARGGAVAQRKRKAEEKVLGRALNKRLTEKYGSR